MVSFIKKMIATTKKSIKDYKENEPKRQQEQMEKLKFQKACLEKELEIAEHENKISEFAPKPKKIEMHPINNVKL